MKAAGFETVIGLEVHVQLATASKLFCPCPVEFGAPPNARTCPVCAGHPGVLPVPNARALELALRAAVALGCTVAPSTRFDRKNYFYPDLPKGYQISQFALPLGSGGQLEIEPGRTVGLERIHMEEDAGKNLHGEDGSRVDLNRAGTPLVEIVSRPDLCSPAEAHGFLEVLKRTMRYAGVSECDMEKGSLRCDANVSLKAPGSAALGTKVEVKNLNSFKMVEKALAFEERRQAVVLAGGGRIVQETRLWDDARAETRSMRTKEFAHDYRYFPEPDIPPLRVTAAMVEAARAALPEMPLPRRLRYEREMGLSPYDASVLTAERALAEYFEALASACGEPKAAANWVMGEVLRHANEGGLPVSSFPVPPGALARLLALVAAGQVSHQAGRKALAHMVRTGEGPEAAVEALGLAQISDRAQIQEVARRVLEASPRAAADYHAGKARALDALKGMVMRETRGRANPALVDQVLRELLS